MLPFLNRSMVRQLYTMIRVNCTVGRDVKDRYTCLMVTIQANTIATQSASHIGIDARLLGYRKGGIAEYTRQLIKALGELDSKNYYTIIHRFCDNETYCPTPHFQRVNAYTPAHHRFERTALGIELLGHRIDLLHSPDFIPPRWGAKQQVITVHDLHFLHYPQFQTADSLRYYRDQIEWSVKHADHIFAQTQGTKNEIIELLKVPEEKITVHLLGVNSEFQVLDQNVIQEKLAPYNLPNEYILFVGTIEPRKNIPNLLRAYAQLREDIPDVLPMVLGGQLGWHADESLQTITDLGLENCVIWFEDVPFDVLPALYNQAQLLVLPSFHEGFGMPAIEAMKCGTPVVVSNRGSLPEVVGEHGLYVEPDDIGSIADGIRRLLEDHDLYKRLQESGLVHARTYSWQRMAEIALDVYGRLLEQ